MYRTNKENDLPSLCLFKIDAVIIGPFLIGFSLKPQGKLHIMCLQHMTYLFLEENPRIILEIP